MIKCQQRKPKTVGESYMKKQQKSTMEFNFTAPCGIYCGDCECYTAKDNPLLLDQLVSKGIKKQSLPCPGCRSGTGRCCVIENTCETYICAADHQVDFCFECSEFPCGKLNPSADRAGVLPHNLKVFNLCFIKNHGLTEFVSGYPEIKQKYYKGKIVIGSGPQL
jgi:hypothetical protein